MKMLKDAKEDKLVLLDNILLLEAKNRFLRAKKNGFKSVLNEMCLQTTTKKEKREGALSTLDTR